MNRIAADPWAKLRRACRDGRGDFCRLHCSCTETARLSVIGHSADVAAVMQALLDIPVISRRLAALLGQVELTRGDRTRLVALTALHDLGKINLGFQRAPFDRNAARSGHIRPVLGLLATNDTATKVRDRLLAAGLRRVQHLIRYTIELKYRTDSTYWPFESVLAHHGALPAADSCKADQQLWRTHDAYDPVQACGDLVEAIAAWLPEAMDSTSIAWSHPFAHAFAGLVTLADWLGSDASEEAFAFPAPGVPDGVARFAWACMRADERLRRLWLAPDAARAAAITLPWQANTLIGFDTPSAAQHAMLSLPSPGSGRVCLIEDETGSGKTEAALIHFLDLFRQGEVDGMYLALPTRAAARQIHGRIETALKRLIGPQAHVTCAVPGYLGRSPEGATLADLGVLYPDEADNRGRDAQWSSERPKRFLASWVAVGTIDQVLLGGLRVRHAQLRSAAMLRLLLVIDEVHSSDVYMTAILRNLLDQHARAGGHALLMSATLGATARARFFQRTGRVETPAFAAAVDTPYPAIWTDGAAPLPSTGQSADRKQKHVGIELDPNWTDSRAIVLRATAAAGQGARVLVIRNTVRLVIETQRILDTLAPDLSLHVAVPGVGLIACPHHARFAPEDRLLLDAALEAALGRAAPRAGGSVAIASQTAEQSLDIDADLLMTDLCPADVLLQRIGRLHRHPATPRPPVFEQPVVIVLAPGEAVLANAIDKRGEVRNGPLALGIVYPDLLGVLATRRALETNSILRIPHDNRALVEAATHEVFLKDLAFELGGHWKAHWQALRGKSGALAKNARQITIDWHQHIQSLNEEEVAKTRLGLDDRIVVLPERTIGPFGTPISTLPLRAQWLHGVPLDAKLSVGRGAAGEITVQLGDRGFTYDRLGLQPVPPS